MCDPPCSQRKYHSPAPRHVAVLACLLAQRCIHQLLSRVVCLCVCVLLRVLIKGILRSVLSVCRGCMSMISMHVHVLMVRCRPHRPAATAHIHIYGQPSPQSLRQDPWDKIVDGGMAVGGVLVGASHVAHAGHTYNWVPGRLVAVGRTPINGCSQQIPSVRLSVCLLVGLHVWLWAWFYLFGLGECIAVLLPGRHPASRHLLCLHCLVL